MTKSNVSAAIDAIVKLARKAHKAEHPAKSAFQEMVKYIAENNFGECFTTPANKLDDAGKAFLEALKKRLARVYSWPSDKVNDYFRHWRMRVKRELTGDTQAKRSRQQRKRYIQIPRDDAERLAETLAMAIEEPVNKQVRAALESFYAALMQKLDK